MFSDEISAKTKFSDRLIATLGSMPFEGSDPCEPEAMEACSHEDEDGFCSVTYSQPIAVRSAQGYSFLIGVDWKNTVEREKVDKTETDVNLASPTLSISMKRT